jgi:hypothetical protein
MTSLFVGTTNKLGLAAGVAFLYIYIWLYGIFLDGPGYFYVRICGSCRFGTSLLTVYLLANEIFPTHLRGKGATCCVASYSLINIMWSKSLPWRLKISVGSFIWCSFRAVWLVRRLCTSLSPIH